VTRYTAAGRLVLDTSRPGGPEGVIRAESDDLAEAVADALNAAEAGEDDA